MNSRPMNSYMNSSTSEFIYEFIVVKVPDGWGRGAAGRVRVSAGLARRCQPETVVYAFAELKTNRALPLEVGFGIQSYSIHSER